MRRAGVWAWLLFGLGMIYFFLPLIASFLFSLRKLQDRLSFEAYRLVFSDPGFAYSFGSSLRWAAFTIVISLLLVVQTVSWVHLRAPRFRPIVESNSHLPSLNVPSTKYRCQLRSITPPPLMLTSS